MPFNPTDFGATPIETGFNPADFGATLVDTSTPKSIFKTNGPINQSLLTPYAQSKLPQGTQIVDTSIGNQIGQFGIGVGKSILDAAQAPSDIGSYIASKVTGKDIVPFRALSESYTTPEGTAQTAGYWTGVAGQFLSPTEAGVRAVEEIPMITKGIEHAKDAKIAEALIPRLKPTEVIEAGEQGKLTAPSLFKKAGLDISKEPEIINAVSAIKNVAGALGKKTTDIVKSGLGQATKNIDRLSNTISEYSQKIISPVLKENPTPFNFSDLRGYFDNVSPKGTLAKSSMETYNLVKERILAETAKVIKKTGRTSSTSDFNDIWNSRKVIDNIIREELGSKTFGTDAYTGVKAAAQDFRSAFKGFLSDSFRYSGQMDKAVQMQETIRAMRSRGIEVTEEMLPGLKEQLGIMERPENLALSKQWDSFMNNLSSLYDAKSNVSTKLTSEYGKSKAQLFGKRYPLTTKALKAAGAGAAATIGGGAIYKIEKSIFGQ